MAKYWMHNGLMQASGEVGKVGGRATRAVEDDAQAQEAGKISKSKGANAFSDLLKEVRPETIRFFLLSTHYRRPIDYGMKRLEETDTALEAFYRFFKRYERVTGGSFYEVPFATVREQGDFDPAGDPLLVDVAARRDKFLEAMDDDFNTGGAIGDLFELLRRLNKYVDDEKLEEKAAQEPAKVAALEQGTKTLRELAATLGLFRTAPVEEATAGGDALVAGLMNLLIEVRAAARKKKDFATADAIRNGLGELGVVLEDRPGGTEWSVQK